MTDNTKENKKKEILKKTKDTIMSFSSDKQTIETIHKISKITKLSNSAVIRSAIHIYYDMIIDQTRDLKRLYER